MEKYWNFCDQLPPNELAWHFVTGCNPVARENVTLRHMPMEKNEKGRMESF